MKTVTWTAPDGREFSFQVCSYIGNWVDASGIYVFARFLEEQGSWQALYVGQCENFSSRIPAHERWQEAVRLGAQSVLACPMDSAQDRDLVEAALIQQFDPPLNKQHPLVQSRYGQ